jgi:hypothetical protein
MSMIHLFRPRHFCRLAATLLAVAGATLPAAARAQDTSKAAPVATALHVEGGSDLTAGEYLTTLGGCNDCHTQGWAESNGKTPAADRFTGSNVGFKGPWGTSYAANLRTMTQRVPEDRWVQILRTADGGEGRPPMPYMNTAAMSDRDLRAMYRYIRSLGAKGERAPRAVPPGQTPTTPYISFEPVQPAPAH